MESIQTVLCEMLRSKNITCPVFVDTIFIRTYVFDENLIYFLDRFQSKINQKYGVLYKEPILN